MNRKNINGSINSIITQALNGDYPVFIGSNNREDSLYGTGLSVNIGETLASSVNLSKRGVVSKNPVGSVIIKKKEFSSLANVNDLQWMDQTEKMLLRCTKTLFAYKVTQIRAYESLTKFDSFLEETQHINFKLLSEVLFNAKYLDIVPEGQDTGNILSLLGGAVTNSLRDISYDRIKQSILDLTKRNAFASDFKFTTWFVDPDNVENYSTGPGTGVIELGSFTTFNAGTSVVNEPRTGSFKLVDPHQMSLITEKDIEIAIEESIYGTLGLLSELSTGKLEPHFFDTKMIVGAATKHLGLSSLDPTINLTHIRKQLRKFYLGKPFISPSDPVYFFIRSNRTTEDFNLDVPFDSRDLEIDETILEAERALFTNKQLDLDTYKKLRTATDNSFGMQCVFVGRVTHLARTFTNGKWDLTVQVKDNLSWLEYSRFNNVPAIGDPQGILEDPLTPFDIETDALGRQLTASGIELSSENKSLLNSGLLTYSSGLLNGQVANERNLFQGEYTGAGSLHGSRILQHPNGFVYKWKTGIYTATLAPTTQDPRSENSASLKTLQQTYGLTVAQDVLNNLDVANIISLLVVGQPYNVETFLEQAYQAHNMSKQSSVSSLASVDPITSVLDVVRRQNIRFGDFKPYRMITLSSSTVEQLASSNIFRKEVNDNLKILQKRRQDLLVRKNSLETILPDGSREGGSNPLSMMLGAEIADIDNAIHAQLEAIRQSTTISTADIATSNFNLFGRNRVLPLTNNFETDYEITRAMTIVGAKRRIEDVRMNRDSNFLIVSDQYDQNTDIRPFLLKLKDAKYSIFKGEFTSVLAKCKTAAEFSAMEFFCNPDGHLEFRPSQYNKTPLSVLNEILALDPDGNKGIVPDFLKEMFQTRTASIKREVHALNIKIAMLCLMLGRYPDATMIPGMPDFRDDEDMNATTVGSASSLRFFGIKAKSVGNAEREMRLRTGNFEWSPFGNALFTDQQLIGEGLTLRGQMGHDGDVVQGDTYTLLGIFDPIFQEEKGILNSVLNTVRRGDSSPAMEFATPANLNKIRMDFRKTAGIDPAADILGTTAEFTDKNFIFNIGDSSEEGETLRFQKTQDILKKLENAIAERDRSVTILKRNREKEKELEEVESLWSVDDNSGPLENVIQTMETLNSAVNKITGIYNGRATRGSLFDHLIEDDQRNLNGPGSGKRYIVDDLEIISCSFNHAVPGFTRVDVVGDAPFLQGLSTTFEEKYFWAGATDFDMWRQYGYISGNVKNLPYANDPETQCRPFAIMELQMQRVGVMSGSMTLIGNEYYRPGDVVYVKSQGLLYYVKGVSHSFTNGATFTTTLDLEYGHPPGEYLPSPIDIIGQQYISNPVSGSTLIYRNQRGDDSYSVIQPDPTIVFPRTIEPDVSNIPVILDHRNNQVKFTNIMLNLNSTMIGSRMVLLRGFVKDRSGDVDRVRKELSVMSHLLQNPVQISQQGWMSNFTGDDLADAGLEIARNVIGTGATKGTMPMVFPNGMIVEPIPATRIIEQIVYLDGTETDIKCMNPALNIEQNADGRAVSIDDINAILPKDGPKQRAWLDIKETVWLSGFMDVSSVIEIGLLDIQRELERAELNE